MRWSGAAPFSSRCLAWTLTHKEGLHRDPRIEKALAMKAKGLSQVAIADELGIDRTTVGRWLKTK